MVRNFSFLVVSRDVKRYVDMKTMASISQVYVVEDNGTITVVKDRSGLHQNNEQITHTDLIKDLLDNTSLTTTP